MTKYLLTKPGGPWDFPALGFSAVDGAILDGNQPTTNTFASAPGPEWSVYGGGSAETGVTRYAPPSTAITYAPVPVPQGLVDAVSTTLFTPGSAAQTALVAATTTQVTQQAPVLGRGRLGARFVFDGNSITIGSITNTTWNQSRSGSWTTELARLSSGRIDYIRNAGIASTGIQSRLDNFATRVAPYSPDVVVLSEGTNDVPGDVNAWLVKLGQYHDLVKGINAQLVLGGIYPKSVNATDIAVWNSAIVKWAAARNVIVIPFWELADPATGGWPAAWTSDGTHPLRESGAYSAMAALAWKTLAPHCSGPTAPTARFVGEGIYTNFFTDLTATMTGVATVTAISEVAGTLPAGLYNYRVVARTHYGHSTNAADTSITLNAPGGSTGGALITSGGTGTYNWRSVYRKGPGESTYRYIGKITGTGSQTFTDNGSLTPTYDYSATDTSRVPNGLSNSATTDAHTLAYGGPIQTDPTIRGNFLRLARQEASGNARADYFAITGLTAGQQLVFTCKARGADAAVNANESLVLFFRTPAEANVDNVTLITHHLGSAFGLVYAHLTVPTGVDRVRIQAGGDATSPYTDIAELRLALES